ncbi:MAG TPA: hypothetical protein VHT28_08775, partial [Silvibacterium sp.]|nr:hypothetical protein [Silvibacterium sp.]
MNIRLITFSLLAAFSVGHAGAKPVGSGFQDTPPPAIPSTPKISIESKPDEWKSFAGYDNNPFAKLGVKSGVKLIEARDNSVMTAMLADPIPVNFGSCYAVQSKTTPEKSPVLSVPYKMPADGEVTLGLFDKDGHLLRWLTQGDFRYAGENKEPWDGLDQYGKPVAAGSYILKAIYHSPITTDYKMSVCNPGNPPWPTADDKGDWLSDEYDPQAAVTDGKWVYLAAPGNELGYSIIAVDGSGQRQWGIRAGSYGRAIALALNGNYLYAVYSGAALNDNTRVYTGKNGIGKAVLMCFDKRTGKPAQF